MVRVESEIFCLALERSSAGKPSASPQRKTSSRTPRSRRSPNQRANCWEVNCLSGSVEQDDRSGWVYFQFAQGGGTCIAQFADFDFGVMLDALDVVVHHGAGFFAAGLAEHDQADFHYQRRVTLQQAELFAFL